MVTPVAEVMVLSLWGIPLRLSFTSELTNDLCSLGSFKSGELVIFFSVREDFLALRSRFFPWTRDELTVVVIWLLLLDCCWWVSGSVAFLSCRNLSLAIRVCLDVLLDLEKRRSTHVKRWIIGHGYLHLINSKHRWRYLSTATNYRKWQP